MGNSERKEGDHEFVFSYPIRYSSPKLSHVDEKSRQTYKRLLGVWYVQLYLDWILLSKVLSKLIAPKERMVKTQLGDKIE